jgi:hypothetical protein
MVEYKAPHFCYFADDFFSDIRFKALFALRLFPGEQGIMGSYHFVIDGYDHHQYEPASVKNPGTSVDAFKVMAAYFHEYFTDLGDICGKIYGEHPEAFATNEFRKRQELAAINLFHERKISRQLGWPNDDIDFPGKYVDTQAGTRPLLAIDKSLHQYYVKDMMRRQSMDIMENIKAHTQTPEEIDDLVTLLGEM